jgi:DNA-binding XRE family transcriptional regulator
MLELKEIGLRVASLRETCGLSATEMAEKLEISEENYIAFEHGEYDFAISTLNNIALILGVDILDIISGESPRLSTCTVVKKGKGFVVNRNPGYEFQHLA